MIRILPILLFALMYKTITAAQVINADIYYSTKKNKTIDVFVKRYELKQGKDTNTITIGFEVGGYIVTQKATKIHNKELTNNCNKKYNKNEYAFDELMYSFYKTTFDISDTTLQTLIKKNCEVRLFYSDTERTGAITTLNVGGKFYIEAMANLCALNNEEIYPEFGNTPIFSLCCNQPNTYNFGYVNQPAIIDSFSFELTKIMDSINRTLSYNTYHTHKLPMTPYCPPTPGKINCKPIPTALPPRGFYFDEAMGDMIFTPTKCDEIGVIAVRINLYKLDTNNIMQKIGYITREMTLIVNTCLGDGLPKITNTTNKLTMCEGKEICIRYQAKDAPYYPNQKKLDTATLTFNQNNRTNATFKVIDTSALEKEADLCWKTKLGDGKYAPYHFTIKSNDKYCTFNRETSKGLMIKLVKDNKWEKRNYKFLVCNKLEVKMDSTNYKSIKWEVNDKFNGTIATSYKFSDIIPLMQNYGSIYNIKCTINDNNYCPKEDTIYNTNLDGNYFDYIDTTICQSNNSINLDNFNMYKNKNAKWYDLNDSLIANNVIYLKNYSFPNVFQATYKLKESNCYIQNEYTFFVYDTIRKYLKNMRICNNSSPLKLFENGFYKRNKGIWSAYPYASISNSGIFNFSKTTKTYNIKYYYDSGYCRNYEQLIVNIEPLTKSQFKADVTSGAPPLLVSFINQTKGTNLKYKWNFGDKYSSGNSSILINPSHFYDSIGKYSVSLITTGIVCVDTLKIIDYIDVKAKNVRIESINMKELGIKTFPNPSSGIINIQSERNFKLKIIDLIGKTILETENSKQIELPKGVYYFKFEAGSNTATEKVIVL